MRCLFRVFFVVLACFGAQTELAFAEQKPPPLDVDLPDSCLANIKKVREHFTCEYKMPDGTTRLIVLTISVDNVDKFARYIGTNRASFEANPRGYMRPALREFERLAVRERYGNKSSLSNTRVQPAKRNSTGLQECLLFDNDYVDQSINSRANLSGIRCLVYNASSGKVHYVILEMTAIQGPPIDRRLPGFDREVRKLVRGLKFR